MMEELIGKILIGLMSAILLVWGVLAFWQALWNAELIPAGDGWYRSPRDVEKKLDRIAKQMGCSRRGLQLHCREGGQWHETPLGVEVERLYRLLEQGRW